jgi:acetyltransferase-like isoleucine patch superfamily enzyme
VSIYTSTHLLGPGSQRMTPDVITRPVRIGDGAWIGVGSVLLPGADVGCGAVVGAGSVVSEPVAAHQLVAGNPAKAVQELPWADR